MNPLVSFLGGAVLGAAGAAILSGGVRERYERIAFTIGVVAALAGAGALLGFGVPAVPGLGKRFLAVAVAGISAMQGGFHFGILAQCPSGGFSSVRTHSMIGATLSLIALSFSLPQLRPA